MFNYLTLFIVISFKMPLKMQLKMPLKIAYDARPIDASASFESHPESSVDRAGIDRATVIVPKTNILTILIRKTIIVL